MVGFVFFKTFYQMERLSRLLKETIINQKLNKSENEDIRNLSKVFISL